MRISSKTRDQIKQLLALLDKDLSDCKNGVQNGWCDESEVAKVEAMIARAKEKQIQISDEEPGEHNPADDIAFLINSIM